MTSANYLLRFDDICPTMNWAVWREIEGILVRDNIEPLLAVVPDNQDEHLKVSPSLNTFWQRVHAWQERGWAIGMHGFQHRYVTRNSGIMGINKSSEFAGLPREEQATKLQAAFEIFGREGIRPDVWIAPAHSFDRTTLELLMEMGLPRISDGFSFLPARDASGMFWIPQQMARFRPMPFGVWSVCLHVNDWGPQEILEFRRDVKRYRNKLIAFRDAVTRYRDRRRGPEDEFFEACYRHVRWIRSFLGRALGAESRSRHASLDGTSLAEDILSSTARYSER